MIKLKIKLRRLKRLRNILIFLAVAAILLYITFEPALNAAVGNSNIFYTGLFLLVLAVLTVVFVYESKYAGAEKFIVDAEGKINDAGYYLTAREEKAVDAYAQAVQQDLADNGYKIKHNLLCDGLQFDFVGIKGGEFFYAVLTEQTDKNDVIAYTNAATTDLTNALLKRRGEAVVLLLCDTVTQEAVQLSKSVTELQTGRHQRLTVYPVIVSVSDGKVYFLGNRIGRAQKMTVNYVMNCELPLKSAYIGTEKLSCQQELAERLENFELKDYKNMSEER
ncbi:MAG: hypothetical protein IJ168_11395 [Eubacterium sp.]|nr:hypothetical protein [Eubacterium sp.]